MYLKKFFFLILVTMFVLSTQSVSAQIHNGVDLVVTCDGVDCVMTPNPADALFDESEWLPGDTITQNIYVDNTANADACNLQMEVTDVSVHTPFNFATRLFTAISKDTVDFYGVHTGGQATSTKTLDDVYGEPFIDMFVIPAGGTSSYDWTVTFDTAAGNEFQLAETVFDFELNFECGDRQGEGLLQLTKSNDTGGADKSPGDSVVYTMTLAATGALTNVVVTDLPPGGFTYQPGSFTANSSVSGPLGISEPSYSSPGIWNLGSMVDGEIITLTYEATIGSDVDAGLYKDLAWAVGQDGVGQVLANATTGVFVGTDVNVVTNNSPGGSYGPSVLGASTELPATGANTAWLIASVVGLASGAYLVRIGSKIQKDKLPRT